MAPRGPDLAPGPSMSTFVPPPWVLAFMMFLLMTIRLYTWYIHDWEHVCYGFRHVSPSRPIHTRRRTLSLGVALCLFLEHKHQDRLHDDFEENPHTPAFPWEFATSRWVLSRTPPGHSYCDLGFLHSRCDQLSLTLAESCWGGRSPVIASPRVSPPPDALCHPRPDSSSLKIVIVQRDVSNDLAFEVAFQAAQSDVL